MSESLGGQKQIGEVAISIFEKAYDPDSDIDIRTEGWGEIIEGVQTNGRPIKIVRPLIGLEDQHNLCPIFTVWVVYEIEGDVESVSQSYSREYFFGEGPEEIVFEVVHRHTNSMIQIGQGEVGDLRTVIEESDFRS